MPEAEADRLCNAGRYERTEARRDQRSGSYDRKLQTKAGEVRLKVPKLRQQTFETAIIERYRRCESSVEEALIEIYRTERYRGLRSWRAAVVGGGRKTRSCGSWRRASGSRQVASTARRYGLSRSLLTTWRRQFRVQDGGVAEFVPAVVVPEAPSQAVPASSRMEIVTRNGRRIVVDAGVDMAALERVLDLLERRR
jgi:transposase-like protein